MTIFFHEIRQAHKRLMLGGSLEQAADAIGAEPQDLDLALWRHICRHGRTERKDLPRSYIARVS